MDNAVLDNYGYPEKPCGKCIESCLCRLSCPMFQAWEDRIRVDKAKLNTAEKKVNRLKVEAILKRFEEWWKHFESQIDPETYANDENEIRKAVARCTWKAALAFVLTLIGAGDGVKEIEKIEEAIRNELRGTK